MLGRILTFVLFLSCAAAFPLSAAELRIGAGAAPAENVLKPAHERFEQTTGIQLKIIDHGPKQAFIDLERNEVDAAAAGLSFDDWLSLLKKERVAFSPPDTYRHFEIGRDTIVVLVHPTNPVSTLSKEQLKGIFTGRISNWKEVGGKDQPIIVVWGSMIQGTNSFFSKTILDGEKVTTDVLQASNAPDIRQIVSVNPEAIGIGPSKIVDSTVKAPKIPEISRPITLITKGEPSPPVKKFLEFLTTWRPGI